MESLYGVLVKNNSRWEIFKEKKFFWSVSTLVFYVILQRAAISYFTLFSFNCFCYFFFSVKVSRGNEKHEEMELTNDYWAERAKDVRKTRLRNRWHLYKMLVLNRSLIKYRYKPKTKKEGISAALFNIANLNFSSSADDKKTVNSEDDNTTLKILIESKSEFDDQNMNKKGENEVSYVQF